MTIQPEGPVRFFRKRPVQVMAAPIRELVEAAKNDWAALPPWVAEAYERGDLVFLEFGIDVRTDHGVVSADLDSWLLQRVDSPEVYPCSGETFTATYDESTPA